uniref:Cleavage stimulating factor 64 n=3 Tax=Rhizophora mucronata TaxID=61149 RepID=A0A2P2KTE3_RHIMU
MASTSQHRCVFVGNIPYDATEEQLIDICREVGPVVSFRLVVDRETKKPKGYGFCEYKDEETALSARRNLQGYEINGRQLRVDFAENDKNADRNREQGRGGPGLAASVDPQKQVGGPSILGESGQHQPIGLHIAITAAMVMAGTLGDSQTIVQSNQNGLQRQSSLANDPLTLHLAKMSRSQLNEIISELKAMATQNREAACQLLIGRPQLSKALFQAQIMLGMVTPQVLQMPNIWQPLGQSALPSLQETQQWQPADKILPGLAPLVQTIPSGLVPRMQEGQFSARPQNSLVHQPLVRRQVQISQHANNVPQQAAFSGQSGVPPLHLSAGPQTHVVNSSSLKQPIQRPLLQLRGQIGAYGNNSQAVLPNPAVQPSLLSQPLTLDASFQPGPSISTGISGPVSKDASRSVQIPDNPYVNMQTSTVHDSKEVSSRPSKLLRLDDGRSMSFSMAGSNVSNVIGTVTANPIAKPEELQYSEKSSQLIPDMESALLQQVLNLSPEQLSSLPLEQQQQVIQLQQALRGGQLRPS